LRFRNDFDTVRNSFDMTTNRRFFRYGELPLVVLFLLEAGPQRGFDVMAELDRFFGPEYRASAGSVYPALSALEAERLIRRTRGDGQRYELTASGRAALEARRPGLSAIENRTGVRLGQRDDLESALLRFTARISPLAGRVDVAEVEQVLDDAADRITALLPRTNPGGNDVRRSV
jgi:DNA-binding PadR family transcriptional regulator